MNNNEALKTEDMKILEFMIYNDDPEYLETMTEKLQEAGIPFTVFEEEEYEDSFDAFIASQELASARYITFAKSTDRYGDARELVNAVKILKTAEPGLYSIGHGPSVFEKEFKNGMLHVNLIEEIHEKSFNISLSAYFIPVEDYKAIEYDRDILEEGYIKSTIELLEKYKEFVIIWGNRKSSLPGVKSFFEYPLQFNPEFYNTAMEHYLMDMVKEDSPRFVKYMAMYLIQIKYAMNLNARDKSLLSEAEARQFFANTAKAIKYIDDDIITDNMITNWKVVPDFLGWLFLRVKYGDDTYAPELDAEIIDEKKPLKIKVIDYDGKNLMMDGRFNLHWAMPDVDLFVKIDGKRHELRFNEAYALEKAFNIVIKKDLAFQLQLPVELITDKSRFGFYIMVDGEEHPLEIWFERAESKLTNRFKNCYYTFGDHILSYKKKSRDFRIGKRSGIKVFGKEVALMANFFFPKKWYKGVKHFADVFKYAVKFTGFRTIYWMTRGKYHKKPVWITMDKIYKAGDNGEYLYRYIKDNKLDKDFDIYYVVDGTTEDYKRLSSQYDTVVAYNTTRHKLLGINCDLMLATHVDTLNCNGFYKKTQQYIKDLYKAKVCCLAHGLTVQKIAQYQNRTFDNTTEYFLASKYEIENLKKPIYDYYDESMLHLTGHGRYDGLKSNDKRQILITPTWRRSLTTGHSKKGSAYAHSESFKHSEYFKIYNGLINDERLIASAKKNGYKIIYLLHPALSAQLEDFESNDFTEILSVADIVYETILTESSLMVTDYSGVQFDFAFQKKPLVYYHPDSLPPQYEEGIFFYDTMGFGEVCKSHEEIVKLLCEYMDNNCTMKPEYIDRVEDFFAYTDYNSCARQLEVLEEIQKKQNSFRR